MVGSGRHVILCGFMGSGKTTLGRRLAKRLGLPFTDLDDMIIAREGMSVPELFAQRGEEGFREAEHAAVLEVAAREDIMVLSTGGGALAAERNISPLRSKGTVIFLNPGFSACYRRIRTTDRPLVRKHTRDQLAALYQTRQGLYRQACHLEAPCRGTPVQCVEELLALLNKQELRPMFKKDIPELLDIWLRASVAAHSFVPPSHWEARVGTVRDTYLPYAETTVCTHGGVPLGFLSMIEGGFIGGLFVSPGAQGRGIGATLLDSAKSRWDKLSLAVYKENSRAVAFYRRHGFQVAVERNSEDSGHPEYVMEWTRG